MNHTDVTNHDELKLRVRAHDPITSIEAAERSLSFSNNHAGRILAALCRRGMATAHELSLDTGLTVVQVDRRLPEAKRDGQAEVTQLNGEDMRRDGYRVWRFVQKNLAGDETKSG